MSPVKTSPDLNQGKVLGTLVVFSLPIMLSTLLQMLYSLVDMVVVTWLFGTVLQLGAFGCFLGYHLATYVTAVPQVIYFCMGTWKNRKRLILE